MREPFLLFPLDRTATILAPSSLLRLSTELSTSTLNPYEDSECAYLT